MKESREKIIEATKALIKEKGYQDLNVQEICRKAYVSRSTFYYQFDSLDDVLEHCFKVDSVIDDHIKLEMMQFKNPLDKLFYFHILYLKQVIDFGIERARFQQVNALRGTMSAEFEVQFLSTTYFIVPYITEAQQNKLILNPTTPEVLAQAITKCMTGSIIRWIKLNGSFDLINDTLKSLRYIYLIPEDYSWKHLYKK